MRRRKVSVADEAMLAQADAMDRLVASQERAAAAQEAHNSTHVTPPAEQRRINALAWSMQSFGGREVETADILLRAECFTQFLRGDEA